MKIIKNKGFLVYRIKLLVIESFPISCAINQTSFKNSQRLSVKINPQKIHNHRSYTIQELSCLLGINSKTCLRWIEKGLKTIAESKKPILIMGKDAKEFLRKKDSGRKCKLKRRQFYCLTCKGATYAKRGSIKITGDKKLAICRVCNGKISRTIKPYQKDYTIHAPPT